MSNRDKAIYFKMENSLPLRVSIYNSEGKSLIPSHLLFQDDAFTTLNLFTGEMTFFESYDKNDKLTKMQLRFKDHPELDSTDLKNPWVVNRIIAFIKSQPIIEVFSYNATSN